MSGDAFVVGDRLIVNQRALGEVGGGDDYASGTLAVWRARNLMGRRGGLECRARFDCDR